MKPTHRFNGFDQLGDVKYHPWMGVEVELIEGPGAIGQSGYNCMVLMRLADFCKAQVNWWKSEEGQEYMKLWSSDDPPRQELVTEEFWKKVVNDQPGAFGDRTDEYIEVEANFQEELEEIK